MNEQRTFASIVWVKKEHVTRRVRFLAEMDAVLPWARLRALVEPHCPKARTGSGLSLGRGDFISIA